MDLLDEIKNTSDDKVKLFLQLQEQRTKLPPPPVEVPKPVTESVLENTESVSSNSSVGKGKLGMKKPTEQLSTHPVAVMRRIEYEKNRNNPEWMAKKAETARRYRQKQKAKLEQQKLEAQNQE